MEMNHLNRKAILYILGFIGLFPCAGAQQSFSVSDPRVEKDGEQVRINYELTESDSSEFFAVSLYISDPEGRLIQAQALSGDIGRGVSGGGDKQILWNPEADQIYMNGQLFFQVAASRLVPAERQGPQAVDYRVASSTGNNAGYGLVPADTYLDLPPASASRHYHRAGIVLQSLLVPGLGLSRMKEKPHWIRGVAGYGCLAGAAYFNLKAIRTYENIIRFESFEEQQLQLDRSVRMDQVSEVLAWSAAAIWVTDLIWNLAGSSGSARRLQASGRSRSWEGKLKITLQPVPDLFTFAPGLGVSYRF